MRFFFGSPETEYANDKINPYVTTKSLGLGENSLSRQDFFLFEFHLLISYCCESQHASTHEKGSSLPRREQRRCQKGSITPFFYRQAVEGQKVQASWLGITQRAGGRTWHSVQLFYIPLLCSNSKVVPYINIWFILLKLACRLDKD